MPEKPSLTAESLRTCDLRFLDPNGGSQERYRPDHRLSGGASTTCCSVLKHCGKATSGLEVHPIPDADRPGGSDGFDGPVAGAAEGRTHASRIDPAGVATSIFSERPGRRRPRAV